MRQLKTVFEVLAADKPAMLEAIKKAFGDKANGVVTLEEALGRLDWQAATDEVGNITDLTFMGDSMGDESDLFQIIAPWVINGSYIELVLETGDYFAYQFHKGQLTGAIFAHHDDIAPIADDTVNLPEVVELYQPIVEIAKVTAGGQTKIARAKTKRKVFDYGEAESADQKVFRVTGGAVIIACCKNRYQFYFLASDGKDYLMSDTKQK